MDARLDFLQELGNIGASHATTALSHMLSGKRLKLIVPKARVLSFSEAAQFINSSEDIVTCIYMQVLEELKGHIVFILPIESSINLASLLLAENLTGLSELAESALLEVGNIMLGSYLTALSLLMEVRINPTVPVIAVDMVGAIWQSILANANVVDSVTVIDTHFSTTYTQLKGHIIFLPSDNSFEKAFSKLYQGLVLEDVE